MPNSMRDIKRRIKSVTSTRQITHAMELVAGAKMRGARQLSEARQAYTDYMIDTLHLMARALDNEEPNVFLKQNGCEKDLFIVLTSDKGLAGGFNSGLLRFASEIMEKSPSYAVIACGTKGAEYFRRNGAEVLASFTDSSDTASLGMAAEIGKKARELFLSKQAGHISIIYNQFVSAISQKPALVHLLPLSPDELATAEDEISLIGKEDGESGINYERTDFFDGINPSFMIFEPSAARIAEKLIPSYVDNAIYGALLESAAGELAARRLAMENATGNADEIIDGLELAYNRARQGAITQEITEIVSGAEAIS